ncbi:DinB family protein [uncultured Croceitalea sp.]|uniref:DinB family protein n=1 Tax=uncultured Croceitalea sp. TaxID=1798908 RepID=UPI003305B24F
MDDLNKFQSEFVKNSCYRMDESFRMIRISLEKISEKEVWERPNTSLNSIGNLILHLCGNMTQYGITSLKGTDDLRERSIEFSTKGGLLKEELIERLEVTVNEIKTCFENVSIERLLVKKKVQGYNFSGIGNIIHVVEHFSYHTGQIAFWVKQITNEQLGFYDGQDLNIKNED